VVADAVSQPLKVTEGLLMPSIEKETYLMSRRSLVEKMLPPELLTVREGILARLNKEYEDLAMVNDVLTGYGYTETIIDEITANDAGVHDADDGTKGAVEHPEDSKWIQRSEN